MSGQKESNDNFKKIGILVYPEVEELDFVGFYEVVQSVKKIKSDAQLSVEIIGTTSPITCANGLIIQPHLTYNGFMDFDVVMIPGGRGWKQLVQNAELLQELQTSGHHNKVICSVCTGAFVLAKAGLLQNRKATTHWRFYRELEPYCLKVLKDRVVVDGNIITAGGVACSLDLGLKVVEYLFGLEISNKLAKRLVIDSKCAIS